MATIQCPRCKHETHVSSLGNYAGKHVKCPSCKQAFRVDSSATSASAIGADDLLNLQDASQRTPFNPLPHVQTPAPRFPSVETRSSGKWSLFNPLTYDPNGATSDKRYPNLLRYIGFAESLTKIVFWIGLGSVALSLLGWEINILLRIFNDDLTGLEGLGGMLVGLMVAGLYVLIVWMWFIFAMAMTEFLRVVIDIENNTHN